MIHCTGCELIFPTLSAYLEHGPGRHWVQPDHPCRRMPTRHCPRAYQGVCGDDRPCARFESDDETPWIAELTGDAEMPVEQNDAEVLEYMTNIARAERDRTVPFATIQIGPFTAICLIGALQLAMRHPEIGGGQLRDLQRIIDQLAPAFEGTPGAEVVRRGSDPTQDVRGPSTPLEAELGEWAYERVGYLLSGMVAGTWATESEFVQDAWGDVAGALYARGIADAKREQGSV